MIYKKPGFRYYMCKFRFQGRLIVKSTKVATAKDARSVEARIRSELARGNWGILEERKPDLTLSEFLRNHFVMGEIQPKTTLYYEYGKAKLLRSEMAKLPLKKINNQHAQKFIAKHVRSADDFKPDVRQDHLNNERYSPSSVNCILRTLRRALFLAHEAHLLERPPIIKMAKNERHRERVISEEEKKSYLEKCLQPCKDVAVLCLNTGMRPSEIYSLRWEDVDLCCSPNKSDKHEGFEYGFVRIPGGKTKAAKRILDLLPESHEILTARYKQQGKPVKGWLFPAGTKSGHIDESSIKKQHAKAIEESKLDPFEFYCFRHTFLTILGASGCDPYTFCRIAGHKDIQMGMRYCHPQEEVVSRAFYKLTEFRSEVVTKGGYHENDTPAMQPQALAATQSIHAS